MTRSKSDSAIDFPPHGQQKRRKSRFLNFSTVSWGSQDSSDDEDDRAGTIATLSEKPASSGSLRSSYFDSKRVLQVGDAGAPEPTDATGTSGERTKPFCVRGLIVVAAACIVAGAGVAVREAVLPPLDEDAQGEPQRLLEIAEQVTLACGQSTLGSDPQECMDLCDEYMCCFDGEGSCAEDENNDCAVYVGCEALVIEAQGL